MRRLTVLSAVLFTGILGILIYPTVIFGRHLPDLGFLAWIYLVPLFVLLKSLRGARLFFAAYLSAMIFYAGSLYWLIPAMKNFGELSLAESSGVLSLVTLILSFYFALGLALSYRIHKKTGLPLFFLNAILLVSFDFLRTYFPVGGFPWSMAAYSQGRYLSYFQWIDVTGIYGLNVLIYLMNGLIAEMILAIKHWKEKDHLLNRLVILVLLIMASFFGGALQQKKMEDLMGETVSLALVQGNVSQEIKWNLKRAMHHLRKYLLLTDQAISDGADLVIWPETAYPYAIDLSNLGSYKILDRDSLAVPLLFGAVSQMPTSVEEEPLIYNSALLVGRDAHISQHYHKQHLVPFGEYVPAKKWLTFARRLTTAVGDFSPGQDNILLTAGSLKIGPLICYEDIFPDIASAFAKKGANLLVNLTNDAWYGDTSAQYQHLVFSQFRALENRRYLVRATNTGMTAVIDPRGEVLYSLPPFTEDVLLKNVTIETRNTFYTRWGDYVAWICLLFSGVTIGYSLFCRRSSQVKWEEGESSNY